MLVLGQPPRVVFDCRGQLFTAVADSPSGGTAGFIFNRTVDLGAMCCLDGLEIDPVDAIGAQKSMATQTIRGYLQTERFK